MKIILISPSTEEDIVSRSVIEIPYMAAEAFFAPHSLAAVAAITPDEWDVSLHDEHLHGPVDNVLLENSYDIIGISLITNQLHRTNKIVELCRDNEIRSCTVIGGIGTTNVMQRLKKIVDVIFIGEAEETWPVFLNDFKKGEYRKTYQQISKPDMVKTPAPKWELIKEDIPRYSASSVQTSRGCHHDCSFCDVIYTYGRKIRSKSVDQVMAEIETLANFGAIMIMIADDNFTADRNYAKEILRRLVKLNNSFRMPLSYMTQVDITVAKDDELLELLADSNFFELQIGIESVNKDSLRHMNKLQNISLDIYDAVKKIQSYGIAVQAHLIIGSDADDTDTFAGTAEFVKEANITHHSCHPLMAPPGTKLWYQLKREGRLIEPDERLKDQLDITSNIIPKNMTRIEMMEGMSSYWDTVTRPEHYLQRTLGFINGIERKPAVKEPGFSELWSMRKMLFNVFKYYTIQVPSIHRKNFFILLRSALKKGNYLVPKIIFLYTRFLMDCIRDNNSSKISREQLKWERDNPGELKLLSGSVPISVKIRENYKEIFRAAFIRVWPRVNNLESLYRIVLNAMIDYSDRFNDTFEEFDEIQLDNVNQSCDRALAENKEVNNTENPGMSEDKPPNGFEREILDALDHVKRYSGKREI